MLKLKDAMLLSRAIDKMGIADDISEVYKAKEDTEAFGIKLFALLGSKLYKAEAEVVSLVASATGKSIEDVSNMSLKELIDVIKGFVNQDGVKDFLSKYAGA